MKEENLVLITNETNNQYRDLIIRAILDLPDGFLPENANEVCSADYIPRKKQVRLAFEHAFEIKLPRGARWVSERERTFSYHGMNYTLFFN